MEFTYEQLQRYARHIVLREVGGVGQEKLLSGKVLVIGAGGLGAPLLLYLAAAGVGTLGVADHDLVELSNLQRQVIHTTQNIGLPKVESAAMAVSAVNPDVKFHPHHLKVTSNNILALIEEYDIIADGSDNFETRFLVNAACHLARKTLVSGAILRFEGQVSTFKSHMGKNYPCYRCLYQSPPPANLVPSCAEGGVIGTLAGTVGSIKGTEVLKEIMGVGTSMAGNLILYNALETEFRKISLKRDTDCPLCGEKPTILDLSIHSET